MPRTRLKPGLQPDGTFVCQSGLTGTPELLQRRYDTYREFEGWSDAYGLAERLGFRTALAAWNANPLIVSTVIPEDLQVVLLEGEPENV